MQFYYKLYVDEETWKKHWGACNVLRKKLWKNRQIVFCLLHWNKLTKKSVTINNGLVHLFFLFYLEIILNAIFILLYFFSAIVMLYQFIKENGKAIKPRISNENTERAIMDLTRNKNHGKKKLTRVELFVFLHTKKVTYVINWLFNRLAPKQQKSHCDGQAVLINFECSFARFQFYPLFLLLLL